MKEIAHYLKENKNWLVQKHTYIADDEANDETLFTLSNGYMGIRGALEVGGMKRAAGTFIAGLFEKNEPDEPPKPQRGVFRNKAITPAYAIVPDSNLLEINANGIDFDFINSKICSYKRTLDVYQGLVFNEYTLENIESQTIEIKTMTFVSKVDYHSVFYKVEIKPINFNGNVTIKFKNSLCQYPQHIRRLNDYITRTQLLSTSEKDGVCVLNAQIVETKDEIKLLSSTKGAGNRYVFKDKNGIDEVFRVYAKQGEVYSFEKQSAYYTTHDDISVDKLPNANQIDAHIEYWKRAWEISDVSIEGDDEVQLGLRWNIFNLMQLAYPENNDISISATGLHGQGYFGHAFWDTEIFMIPFYLATNVSEAKSLLMYRYNRLDKARKIAQKEGLIGAQFPWTSTYTGNDVTPPDWADCSKREIHICGAIAYGMYNYYIQTNDYDFYKNYGIETIVETAKFYASRSTLGEDDKYHLIDVTGPDEFNIHVKDNFYTNYLAVWNIKEALSSMEKLKMEDVDSYNKIAKVTNYTDEVKKLLLDVSNNMFFPQARDNVYEQYDGFFNLIDKGEFPKDEFGMPLDRKRIFNSGIQELKQADVVMMFYLFPDAFPEKIQKESFLYYEKRCKHGSSLSPSIHCIVGLRNGFYDHAYGYLYLTALLDLKNLHLEKNLYEGVHIACAGGTWSAVVYGFGGVNINGESLHIDPIMPEKWTKLSFSFLNKGRKFDVRVEKEQYYVKCDTDCSIFVKNKETTLQANEEYRFDI